MYNLIYGRGWVILKDTEDFKEHESCEYGQGEALEDRVLKGRTNDLS